MMRPNASLHADETRRQVGQPCFHLPARPLLPKHDCTTFIVPHHVTRILADIDTDHGDCRIELVWHGVLLVFGAPLQLPLLAGPEHGRTIPLADKAADGWEWKAEGQFCQQQPSSSTEKIKAAICRHRQP